MKTDKETLQYRKSMLNELTESKTYKIKIVNDESKTKWFNISFNEFIKIKGSVLK